MTNADRIRNMTDDELASFVVIHQIMGAIAANGVSDPEQAKNIAEAAINSAAGKKDIETALNILKQEVKNDDKW